MGMALPHDAKAVFVRGLGALVAGDDARGHVHRPHHHHEGAGEVLAEALAPVEPELVDRITAVGARLQRVDVVGLADVRGQRGGQRACVGRTQLGAHLPGPGHRARVEARWQRLGREQFAGIGLLAVAEAGPGLGADAQAFTDQPRGVPLQVVAQPGLPVLPALRRWQLRCAAGAGRRGFQQR